MINLPASYTNTSVADGALNLTTSQNQNFSSAQTRNTPVEPQTPNRVSSPEQVAAAVKNPSSSGAAASSAGALLDVRA